VMKSRRLQWAGHVALTDETKNAYRVLVGKSLGKCSLRREGRLTLRLNSGGWEMDGNCSGLYPMDGLINYSSNSMVQSVFSN